MANAILSSNRTRKTIVTVSEAVARAEGSGVDIGPDDLFVEGVPPIPKGLYLPRLLVGWKDLLAANPAAQVWEEADPDAAAKDISAAAESKCRELWRDAEAAVSSITSSYPGYEMLTWDMQEREARDYVAWKDAGATGTAPTTPTLSPIATERGMDLLTLAQTVITKADTYRATAAHAAGRRRALCEQVQAIVDDAEKSGATKLSDIEAITW